MPSDNRDLNYDKYFNEGNVRRVVIDEFNSDNLLQLIIEDVREKLTSLEYVQKAFKLVK